MSIKIIKTINAFFEYKKLSNYDMKEVKISIYDLKLNPYNDRFAMENYDFKGKKGNELGFDYDSQEHIFKILWEKDIEHNKKTKKDILKNGILKPIYIDKKGVILDGNRRITILKKILDSNNYNLPNEMKEDFEKPKVVMICKDLNELEIRDIETILQISEDEKVPYDPINMYIKIDRLYQQKIDKRKNNDKKTIYKEVSDLLGPDYQENKVKQNHKIFKFMEKYLRFHNKENQYIFLEKKDDHLKRLWAFEKSFIKKTIDYTGLGDKDNYNGYEERSKEILAMLFNLTSLRIEGKIFRKLVPTANSVKSPLQHKKGFNKIQKFVEKKCSDPHFLDVITNNTYNDKAIDGIINSYSNFQKTKDHKLATIDFFKRINNIIDDLESWFEGIEDDYVINNNVFKKFYEVTNAFKQLAKKYKDNGKSNAS